MNCPFNDSVTGNRSPPPDEPRLTLLPLAAELDHRLVQGQVAVYVRRRLLVVLIVQRGLHAVHAELQVQDVVGALDHLVKARLHGHTACGSPYRGPPYRGPHYMVI